jgi:hypothetical protein
VPSAWCLVLSAWCSVPGAECLVLVPRAAHTASKRVPARSPSSPSAHVPPRPSMDQPFYARRLVPVTSLTSRESGVTTASTSRRRHHGTPGSWWRRPPRGVLRRSFVCRRSTRRRTPGAGSEDCLATCRLNRAVDMPSGSCDSGRFFTIRLPRVWSGADVPPPVTRRLPLHDGGRKAGAAWRVRR